MSDDPTKDEARRDQATTGDDDGRQIKVSDRRMFTPEGELREEYRFLEEGATGSGAEDGSETARETESVDAPEPAPEPPRAATTAPASGAPGVGRGGGGGGAPIGGPGARAVGSGPSPGAGAKAPTREASPRKVPGGGADSGVGSKPGVGPQPGGGPTAGGGASRVDAADAERGAPLELPGGGPGSAGFLDLVSVLAEPAAVYLGDARLPDGGSAENLEAARLYIDLLDVLRKKTAGNLSPQESNVLQDVVYRLRSRYVQKRG